MKLFTYISRYFYKGAGMVLLVFIFFAFILPVFRNPDMVMGSATDNVSGWAWSENIGWISFNCTDDSCVSFDYGVSIDDITGEFLGYAWSENIGWIDFAPVGPYPEVPDHSARLEADDTITGWAKVLSADDNGWDGWVKLSDTVLAYGVKHNVASNELEGFAWGSDVIGWISFNSNNCDTDDNDFIDAGCGGDNSTTLSFDYAVVYSAPITECNDGADNSDADLLVDADDPGCHTDWNPTNSGTYESSDNDEGNEPACSNSVDDDNDGYIDADDPGCHTDSDLSNPYQRDDDDENTCGDNTCDTGETFFNCPSDCLFRWFEI